MKNDEIRKVVRDGYAEIAKPGSTCCGPAEPCCVNTDAVQSMSESMGYSKEELAAIPDGADLGLSCGNPIALASLKEGETVLDLGSGAGKDCFLAATKVGENGRVIGVDMTQEMIERARANAVNGGYANVEFRLGEIENLPVADGSVDVVVSNCVINLSPDKERVFAEAFRVLEPGGRLMVSDLVLTKELPEPVRDSVEAYVGCLAGAMLKNAYLGAIETAGFEDVRVEAEASFPLEFMLNDPTGRAVAESLDVSREEQAALAATVLSVKVFARKGQ